MDTKVTPEQKRTTAFLRELRRSRKFLGKDHWSRLLISFCEAEEQRKSKEQGLQEQGLQE